MGSDRSRWDSVSQAEVDELMRIQARADKNVKDQKGAHRFVWGQVEAD